MQDFNEKQQRSLVTKKEYTHFREHSGISFKDRIRGRDRYNRFVLDFYKEIADRAIENEAGILVPRLGYFYIWKTPISPGYNYFGKQKFNFGVNKNLHIPVFYPVRSLYYYSMDKSFSEPFKNRLRDKLKEGKKYKHYAYTLKRLGKI